MVSGSSKNGSARLRAVGIMLSLTAILVTLLIAEVILRSTHAFGARLSWCQPDPVVTFRYTPNRPYWNYAENDHPITGRINSFGWRDRQRSLEKPPCVYRVAFLGDSLVEAFQVESDSTFLALAEDDLNSRLDAAVELMNFGRSGVAQTEEFVFLQSDVMSFSPDLVAVLFNPTNDIDDVASGRIGLLRSSHELAPDGELQLDTSFNRTFSYRARAAISGIKQRSALVSLLAERWNLLEQTRLRRTAPPDEGRLQGYLSLCASRPDTVYVKNYRLCKALIREMARSCDRRGVRFLLVCGSSVYEREDLLACVAEDPAFDPYFFEADLACYADSLGIDYLGLETPFLEHCAAGGGSLHWGHYNYVGHRVVARVLGSKLTGIISERPYERPTGRERP